MLHTLTTKRFGNESAERLLHEGASREHASRGLLKSTSLDGLSDEGDPGMELAFTETAKRLTESHVADDIERREV